MAAAEEIRSLMKKIVLPPNTTNSRSTFGAIWLESLPTPWNAKSPPLGRANRNLIWLRGSATKPYAVARQSARNHHISREIKTRVIAEVIHINASFSTTLLTTVDFVIL